MPQPRGATNDRSSRAVSPWATNATATIPQITISADDYNRIVRMIEAGEKLKMAVELKVAFHDELLMQENTIAEIPGTDLKNEIVMVGAHMDSWHSGTGATDNGAGVAATMEAVRIIRSLNLKPRRTIRIALWSGEEQGLYGSRAYVAKHFGYYTNFTNTLARSPRAESNENPARLASSRSSQRKLIQRDDYENLSAYYNLDNGTGKIRGIYLQGNEGLRSQFRRWLQPFADLGAETISSSNTGQTDHVPFNDIGLPGFQFIQDPIDYMSRTHHSNADVYDRIQEEDLKQAATIMAAFLYNTAMADERLMRKPLDEPVRRPQTGIAAN
jgi:carboxypeptidase Q